MLSLEVFRLELRRLTLAEIDAHRPRRNDEPLGIPDEITEEPEFPDQQEPQPIPGTSGVRHVRTKAEMKSFYEGSPACSPATSSSASRELIEERLPASSPPKKKSKWVLLNYYNAFMWV